MQEVTAVAKRFKNVAGSKLFGKDSHISELYKMVTEAADCSETTVPIYGTPALHPQTCSRIRNLEYGIRLPGLQYDQFQNSELHILRVGIH